MARGKIGARVWGSKVELLRYELDSPSGRTDHFDIAMLTADELEVFIGSMKTALVQVRDNDARQKEDDLDRAKRELVIVQERVAALEAECARLTAESGGDHE